MKIGRNDKCSCGSGKKFKFCCRNIDSGSDANEIPKDLHRAMQLSLQHNKADKDTAISIFENIIHDKKSSKESVLNSRINFALTKQHLGEHALAAKNLKEIEQEIINDDPFFLNVLRHYYASSLCALGQYDASCAIADSILHYFNSCKSLPADNRRTIGVCFLELGKIYSQSGFVEKSEDLFARSLQILEEFEGTEAEHIYRAKSNIAFRRLKSKDEAIQEDALKKIHELTASKLSIGDLQGVANNYSTLGIYFWRKKKYERALSHTRKDLFLCRKFGDLRDTAATLGNLAIIYADLLQYPKARACLNEAQEIAKSTNDQYLADLTNHQRSIVEESAKEAGIGKVKIVSQAICACGSGKLYKDCCEAGDQEPIDLPVLFGGISEDVFDVGKKLKEKGVFPSPLDFILRDVEDSDRRAWSQIDVKDGWTMKMSEMPDMARIHINSAKQIHDSTKDNDSIEGPLAVVILSVCYLEAFINQLSWFLKEHGGKNELSYMQLPPDLMYVDALDYQRKNSLEKKWAEITDCLIAKKWLSACFEWSDVADLIYIRNELVHFKANGYEQVVPPTKNKDGIYKRFPTSLRLRDTPHSWPFKLLTPELSNWAISISVALVSKLKDEYHKSRLMSSQSK